MPDRGPKTVNRSGDDLREVAGYHLLRAVGEGGMSSVFLSYDRALGMSIAVKLLAEHLAHSQEFVGRFYREARLSRLLSHPNLVRGLAAGYDPVAARHYLILEFIDGPTTQSVLGRVGRFPVGVAVRIAIDIAHALAFLHTRQYVHRDVKPDNILLHPSGIAKLADLGLAKRLNDDPHITSTHLQVGTSYYMAYEQTLNGNFVDGRSDIFALGASLYHLLTGEVPFPGATHEEIIRTKEHGNYRPICELNHEVPTSLAEIVAATLARDPRSRIQSAAELAAALESTGLAEPIPQFAQSDASENAGGALEAPTRADISIPNAENLAIDDSPPRPSQEITQGTNLSPLIRRPNYWLPFRVGLIVFLVACLCGILVATKGVLEARDQCVQPPMSSSNQVSWWQMHLTG